MVDTTNEARVLKADRTQPRFDIVNMDAWLPQDHVARAIWAFTGTLDLAPFYARIKAREGDAGRPAIDPRLLLALWLYAIVQGVGSARALDRLCNSDLAYQWICGGVAVNYHTLADFRVQHGDEMDTLLTQSLTAMIAEGLVAWQEVCVDGTKIRASAGKNSYRRSKSLDKLEAEAKARVAALKAEVDADPAALTRRQQAARGRAARERLLRVKKAQKTMAKLEKEKAARTRTHKNEENRKNAPRASITDDEARVMRFSDGAVRAGYNVQVGAVAQSGIILGITVTDRRNDTGQAGPLVEEIERRLGRTPERLLADTGYATADDIVALADRKQPVTVFAPPPPDKKNIKPESLKRREKRREKEPQSLKDWRVRMAGDEAAAVMKRRSRIELVNAHLKARGFGQMSVRGLEKIQTVAVLHALAHNLMTALHFRKIKAAAA